MPYERIIQPERRITPQPMSASAAVWVHFDGWSGRIRAAGELVWRSPKYSRVLLLEDAYGRRAGETLRRVPNQSITPRDASQLSDGQ